MEPFRSKLPKEPTNSLLRETKINENRPKARPYTPNCSQRSKDRKVFTPVLKKEINENSLPVSTPTEAPRTPRSIKKSMIVSLLARILNGDALTNEFSKEIQSARDWVVTPKAESVLTPTELFTLKTVLSRPLNPPRATVKELHQALTTMTVEELYLENTSKFTLQRLWQLKKELSLTPNEPLITSFLLLASLVDPSIQIPPEPTAFFLSYISEPTKFMQILKSLPSHALANRIPQESIQRSQTLLDICNEEQYPEGFQHFHTLITAILQFLLTCVPPIIEISLTTESIFNDNSFAAKCKNILLQRFLHQDNAFHSTVPQRFESRVKQRVLLGKRPENPFKQAPGEQLKTSECHSQQREKEKMKLFKEQEFQELKRMKLLQRTEAQAGFEDELLRNKQKSELSRELQKTSKLLSRTPTPPPLDSNSHRLFKDSLRS